LPEGEVVQGGAFTCATAVRPAASSGVLALLSLLGLSVLRRSRRRAP
jgi:MYXO-CTERM domain-containing protein